MKKELVIEVKSVYGNQKWYPACQESKLLTKLTGTKTFTDSHIATLKELGYTFKSIDSFQF